MKPIQRQTRTTTKAAAILVCASGMAVAQFEITRSGVNGGGVIGSTGGAFELSATTGRSDAGVLTGGQFILTGGFWFETPPGDCNQDGGTGLLDMHSFTGCMTGPNGAPGIRISPSNSDLQSGVRELGDDTRTEGSTPISVCSPGVNGAVARAIAAAFIARGMLVSASAACNAARSEHESLDSSNLAASLRGTPAPHRRRRSRPPNGSRRKTTA